MVLSIINWLIWLIEKIGYLGVFTAMFIESFFAPIPSELILPFAGFLSHQGTLNIYLVILLSGIASTLGSLPFYLLGYWGNDLVVNRFLKRYGKFFFIAEEDVEKGILLFTKHGKLMIFAGRLIPIIRTVISFPAGLVKMSFTEFVLFTLAGSTIWSAFLALAGYVLGSQWEVVSIWIEKYQTVIIVCGVAAFLLFVFYKIGKKRLKRSD
ncbi:MAG: hypothetical protein UT34_C0001G0106 [candidate division WS6 bacterium GW2011_GWF2_39_15]|uniref:VTT domain-containing protein n=1 Tax=candidate division WS6 bacterium GW2011_GWF2_39_15 TaxID=1619100 RepID=A0A0G0MZQ7_9BACT|nr:MAG: hypothetical protein UT34_C0001G0106 [candidate division WS6 bacterium GW2011_GWF2_39_15]